MEAISCHRSSLRDYTSLSCHLRAGVLTRLWLDPDCFVRSAFLLSNSVPVAGNTSHTKPENRAFFPALDGLRAVAFLMVFFQHYQQLPWGWTGVNIFFVLSGFLITGILFDTKDDPHRARNFYVRRTLRIFPLYYAVFLALLLLQPLLHWRWSLAWIAWPLYVANFLRFRSPAASVTDSSQELSADAHLGSARLPNTQLYLGHFWSLCVEEQFYLFWPWIVFWVGSRRALLWICAAAVVAVPLLRLWIQQTAPSWMLSAELLYRATPFQLDALLLGGLAALLWRGSRRGQLVYLARFLALIMSAAAVIYLARTVHFAMPNWCMGYVYPSWKFTWGLMFVNVFSAALMICILVPGGWVYRFFCLRPLRWIGRISYGAYVLHDIVHDLYVHIVVHLGSRFPLLLLHRDAASTLLALIGTLSLAWLSFRILESPFLNLKERWTRSSLASEG